jgi:hypothetical protein
MQKINQKSHLVRVRVSKPELSRPQGDDEREEEKKFKHF